MSDYEMAVVAECPEGHQEANLLSNFSVKWQRCARCNGHLEVVRTGLVRVHAEVDRTQRLRGRIAAAESKLLALKAELARVTK